MPSLRIDLSRQHGLTRGVAHTPTIALQGLIGCKDVLSFCIFDVLHMPWWSRGLFLASRSPLVANEGVLESPGPLGARTANTSMSKGQQPTSRGRILWWHAYHGDMHAPTEHGLSM